MLLDFYENPFDIYRYTFTITVTLMIGGVFFRLYPFKDFGGIKSKVSTGTESMEEPELQ